MKITELSVQVIRLPFRFSFKHSLASHNQSDNVIVRALVEHEGRSYIGFGESIPRDYVTGEDAYTAAETIRDQYFPRFQGQAFGSFAQLREAIAAHFFELQLDKKQKGASWCALELALLDAGARAEHRPLANLIGGINAAHKTSDSIVYGGVIPFGKKRAFTAVLWFYKFFGFKTVKIKVGRDFDGDLERIALARKVLGNDVILRADANCAWNLEETLRCAQRFRQFGIASYEQPVPAIELEALAKISASIEEDVLADESLCSIDQARTLAAQNICTAFNIRISKVGGIAAAAEIARIARENGIKCHMGAQVGESGILSAAGRSFASAHELFDNYEGSNNFFLLQQDITAENLNVGPGGIGKLLHEDGLGISVLAGRLAQFAPSKSLQQAVLAGSNNQG
jgi:L-alanine-DL-glutamate epimerase-like enolase superfamily enzyme